MLLYKVSIKERRYIKSPVGLCRQSNVKLLNLRDSCEFDVLLVFLVIFFSFSIGILITFHLTTVFIKNLSLMNLLVDNLCFSIWYHNMLQSGKNQIYSNSTGLLIYLHSFIDTLYT
jgi:hypothetical protein